jgi:ABC-type nitrate/sulfonate/bicarbonate transport system substrate-binding protein
MPHHYHLKMLPASFWITFLGVALLPQQQASAQQLRRIYYGTSASVSHLPVWVAKDAGLFAKKGLNVEPVQIRGGALITLGIMGGQLQFSGVGRHID